MKDILISDFLNPVFQEAFQLYFKELGINVKEWDGLFKEMNDEGDNKAYVRMTEDSITVGFIMFKPIKLSNWFFEESMGFIREFWIAEKFRSRGHGSALLQLTETYFLENGICKSILTTDTAERFYISKGYKKDASFAAKNEDDVFIKELEKRC